MKRGDEFLLKWLRGFVDPMLFRSENAGSSGGNSEALCLEMPDRPYSGGHLRLPNRRVRGFRQRQAPPIASCHTRSSKLPLGTIESAPEDVRKRISPECGENAAC